MWDWQTQLDQKAAGACQGAGQTSLLDIFVTSADNLSSFGVISRRYKGWKKKKTRPHETLTNANSKVLYRIKNIILRHQCIVKIKIVNWYKAHFSCILKNNNNLFCWKKTLLVCLKVDFTKKFRQNFYFFFSTFMQNKFLTNSWFLTKTMHWCCYKKVISHKTPTNMHWLFILTKKKVLVC